MAIVGMIAGIVSLVCWILTVIKAFQSGSTTNGVLSICGIIGFVLGWMNVKQWNHQPVMIAWTVSTLIGIVANVLGAQGVPGLAP